MKLKSSITDRNKNRSILIKCQKKMTNAGKQHRLLILE